MHKQTNANHLQERFPHSMPAYCLEIKRLMINITQIQQNIIRIIPISAIKLVYEPLSLAQKQGIENDHPVIGCQSVYYLLGVDIYQLAILRAIVHGGDILPVNGSSTCCSLSIESKILSGAFQLRIDTV